MKILVSGSMAFDYLLNYEGNFSEQIKSENIDTLSVAFFTPSLHKQFGGCAGNICYNLRELGIDAYPVATIGSDFKVYAKWLKKINMPTGYLMKIKKSYTAQAFIISDSHNHQITAFHPGAMTFAHKSVVRARELKKDKSISIGIVAPNGLDAMIQQAKEFKKAGIAFIFDPGQGLGMFNKEQLEKVISQASWLVTNQYESKILCEKLQTSEKEIAKKIKAVIVTDSEKGSRIYADNDVIKVEAVKVNKAIDPTGCGDAYRSGLIYGILNQLSWQKTAMLSNVIGAIKVQSAGPQNHQLSFSKIKNLYQETYHQPLKI